MGLLAPPAERHGTVHADGVPVPTYSLSLKTDAFIENRRSPRMMSSLQTPGFSSSVWLAHKVLRSSSYRQGGHRKEIKMSLGYSDLRWWDTYMEISRRQLATHPSADATGLA